jgi:hypothetical protein
MQEQETNPKFLYHALFDDTFLTEGEYNSKLKTGKLKYAYYEYRKINIESEIERLAGQIEILEERIGTIRGYMEG